ncbi:MAG: amidohydrolase family protein [Planctomycetia bacterium]|nr:amidohydrolase family protein [Planctomycetia bacterium]
MESRLGTLEVGKSASLIVADGPLFEDKTKIVETWVDGRRYEIVTSPAIDVRGIWQVTVVRADGTSETLSLGLRGEPGSLAGTLSKGDKKADLAEPTLEGAKLQFRVTADEILGKGVSRLSANVTLGPDGDTMLGRIALAEGGEWPLAARRTADLAPAESPTDPEPEAKAPPKTEIAEALFPVNYPLGAFGRPEMPEQQRLVLFKNATVWTSGPQGTLKNASVLVASGKIRAVGQEIEAPEGAVVIDLSGKHLTPGLIDCHSHIATDGGINETGQTITAEVRIGDFVDCDDVNIYRQLAGGVTAANVLHGSANTIGGQNQVIKMRWGALPEEIKFAQAPQGIKFALGENVKQSNWGDKFNTRYPQTRMGVEQLVPNAFEAALAYGRRWEEWEKTKAGLPPRVDLELQTILEILQGKRLIHCHSYRQDEIVALIRTCERYQVRIGTLQHILEGYKIADIIARHGAGGSSFSDWWAYKFEVLDAIPYNGALMHSAGVVVSFNSDDAELARRLNTEAAKAVKYGGVSEVEALKFVTLNPARQLRIDGYVGSIEPGKDADLAVWSAPPLSSRAVCEQSWVDGRKLFDRQEDIAARPNRESMRAALIQRILATNAPMAEPGEPISRRLLWPREDLYCGHHDHGDEEGREQYQQ